MDEIRKTLMVMILTITNSCQVAWFPRSRGLMRAVSAVMFVLQG